MTKTPYKLVSEAFKVADPEIEVDNGSEDAKVIADKIKNIEDTNEAEEAADSILSDTAKEAEENYENVPDEFVEYKYQDKLNDVRKDIDYFKTRLDESESDEAKQKYLKIIGELIEQEKKLICVTTTNEKHNLDKKCYVAKQVASKL